MVTKPGFGIKRLVSLQVLLLIAACGSLPDAGGGIVSLEITQPNALSMPVDSPIAFHARALDSHGDSVAAQIIWRTPDTAIVTLDSITGLVVGKIPGIAQVQANVVTIHSPIFVVTILPPYSGLLFLTVSGLPDTPDFAQCSVTGPNGPIDGGAMFSVRMGDPPSTLNKLAPGQYLVTWADQTINGRIYRAAAVHVQVSDSTAPVTATGAYH